MTAKEKAKKLTDKYYKGSDLLYQDISWIQAKECAKIAIQEILDLDDFSVEGRTYWIEVNIELERI